MSCLTILIGIIVECIITYVFFAPYRTYCNSFGMYSQRTKVLFSKVNPIIPISVGIVSSLTGSCTSPELRTPLRSTSSEIKEDFPSRGSYLHHYTSEAYIPTNRVGSVELRVDVHQTPELSGPSCNQHARVGEGQRSEEQKIRS